MKKNILLKIFVFVVAVILWLQQIVLREHKQETNIPLKLMDLPSDLIVGEELPLVGISYHATGFEIVKLHLANIFVEVDASNFKFGKNYFQISQRQIKFPRNVNIELDMITTNTNLSVFIDKTVTRYKPIRIQFDTDDDEEFFLKNKIINEKQNVEVKGPSRKLQKIEAIKTEKINKNMVSAGKLNARLISPDPQINLASDKVTYDIMQTRIVSKIISLVPVSFPEELNISIIPQKISLMVKGPEDILRELDVNSVEAKLDVDKIKKDFTTVSFKLPSGVELVEYTPKRIKVLQNK